MRLGALLDTPELGLTLLTGAEALEREFGRVFQATLQDPTRYLSGGEIVLCGLRWLPGPTEAEEFVGVLAAAGVVALGAGTAEVGGPVPEHLVESCRRVGLPLFEVPLSVSFATVTERVILGLAAERSAPAHDSHRRLVAAVTSGEGLPALVVAGAAELGVDCWVLSATGRLIAGTGALPGSARRAALARRFLRAERLPLTVPGDDGPVTLLAAASRSGHRVASWFLVADGDLGRWAPARRELALELAPLIGLERSRVDEAKRIENRVAEPLLRLALSDDASAAELSSRLAAAEFPAHAPVVTLSASVTGGGPGLTQVLVEELLAAVPGPTLVATVDGETFGLFPASGRVAESLRESVRALEPALGSARLAVGLSRAPDAAGLRAGLQEARHARTLAALSPGRASVLAGDEVASHLLLLAAVPDDLRRSFGEKVLGPVLAYDAAHGSELLGTLKAFLEHSGSWTQTSSALHLHVNTLRYRISRISELTGRDLGRFADRVDLYLAGCFTQDWGWS
ncbi:helix-turn-helix domain-containing protein [Amycolatopsis rhabdoformis]|uniref:Helix-turn-helix domain-containing protein n=1 Tax=Amycolatopsis rhabdoformis TaxID=1448059 RepID=A0ABZ1HWT3_9PSEU|nr:helix-turn-helix domain-containing protein [Amycolatopsis rhabdoformis]WSE26593.1 helix-turn-helix domain-containing protein [Amycolatopsis rhabdoformis]